MDKNRDSSRGKSGPGSNHAPASPAAKARSAAALRENLQRRKAQARAREEHKQAAAEDAGPDDAPG